jgi:starch phosphorylase
MLQLCRQARLKEVAGDEDFKREMHSVFGRLQQYMKRPDTWGKLRQENSPLQSPVAYSSAEFGFHESVPNYSGGLGILSGDHCKSASDLDIPFIAFTLLYRHGYFSSRSTRTAGRRAFS